MEDGFDGYSSKGCFRSQASFARSSFKNHNHPPGFLSACPLPDEPYFAVSIALLATI